MLAFEISREMQIVVIAEIIALLLALLVVRWRRSRRTERGPAVAASRKSRLGPPDRVWGYMTASLVVAVMMVAGVGSWAATSELAGAVIASGTVVVDSNVKKVQHPTGGIVGEIRVRDGDRVRSGDLLMRLDDTITRANLAVVTKQLDELIVRQARLKAERDGASRMETPPALQRRLAEPNVAEMISAEATLFQSRRDARAGQKAQMRERMSQLQEEIGGLAAQVAAKSREIELIQKELAGQHELWNKNLLPITKYTQTQREATRLDGERGQLLASVAQARGKISEIELQIIQIGQDLRSEVVKELREVQAKEAELLERQVAAQDQLKRIEIRAPLDGIVHQLSVHTVGGVISPSESVMLIVPEGDKLVIEARIAPQDIDHVRPAHTAFVRFTAFNQRTTPEFTAVVQRVSADLTREAQANLTFYVVRLVLLETEVKRMGTLQLVPGMPAEIHIKTAERTALSYLVKPLQDQFARAFREQ